VRNAQSSDDQRLRPIAGRRDPGEKRENPFGERRRLETRPLGVARIVAASWALPPP
jgi:hypothetical protein